MFKRKIRSSESPSQRAAAQNGGRHPRNRRFLRSYYAKFMLAMSVVVISIFLLVGIAYLNQLDSYLVDSETAMLTRLGNRMHQNIVERHRAGAEIMSDRLIKAEMQFVQDSELAYVWLVSPDGVVVRYTDFPGNMDLTAVDPATGRVKLPENLIGADTPDEGYVYVGSNYFGLFNYDNLVWISYVRPIRSDSGALLGVLQIHDPLNINLERRGIFINGLGITILVSLVLGGGIVLVASQRMVRPLRELTDMASKVAKGDLSVRVPDQFADEDAEAYMLSVQDEMTVLRRTFNTMVEKLDHMNTDRRDMLSSISHDLRTPLTSIQGFVTGMLEGAIPPERYPRYLGIVQQESARMANLVNQMHEMVMLDSNAIQYNFVELDLQQLVTGVITSLEPQLAEKRLTVQTNFTRDRDDRKKLTVIGDEQQLQRVFSNLIFNAIKFTPDGGVIAVSTVRPLHSQMVVVSVEDSGTGLNDDELNLVFNRFYKSDRSRTGHQGSGLGLYITRQILNAHGQHITAGKSSMGGAKFTFTLQLAKSGLFDRPVGSARGSQEDTSL